MARLLLFQESFALFLCSDSGSLWLETLVEGQTQAAEFPVQISLLRAVENGFSYQIANEHGSLNIAKSGPKVGFTIHLASNKKLTAQMPSEIFSTSVAEIGE